jgi:hypothetical protein
MNLTNKNIKGKRLLNKIKETEKAIMLCQWKKNIKETFSSFYLDKWESSHSSNKTSEIMLSKSEIRPFGNWFETNFGTDTVVHYHSWWSIFSIDKRDVLAYPKEWYINFMRELESSSNPEVGHYLERSWCAVFHPLVHTKVEIY